MTEENRNKKNMYAHSKIYKLQCDDGYFYIGHTTQHLNKRISDHKERSKINFYKDMKIYKHILSIGWDSVKPILISEHALEAKEQLLKEENKVIEQYFNNPFCLNSYHSLTEIIPIQEKEKQHDKYYNTYKKRYEENKELFKEKFKKRYEENKEMINQQKMEYYQKNKEVIRIKNKIYKDCHKEDSLKRNEKVTCECGAVISKRNISTHKKTQKHLNYANNIIT